MYFKNLLFIGSTLLFFVACGSGGGSKSTTNVTEEPSTPLSTPTFKGLEIYNFSLGFKDGERNYNMQKIDPITSTITPYSFDFSAKEFTQNSVAQTIFIDGKRHSTEDITFSLNSKGEIESQLNQQRFSTLTYKRNSKLNKKEFKPYRSTFQVRGERYDTTLKYHKDVVIIDKLASNSTFNNLQEFINSYGNRPFIGSLSHGLLFGGNGQLKQIEDGNITQNGTYQIKTMGREDVIVIYPTNPQTYYIDHTCYILDFARVWQGKCYKKNSTQSLEFYSRAIFESTNEYLQNSFVEFNISI